MPTELAPGSVIGRYTLERMIGEGGMGSVWAATHALTRKHVALKFLKGAAAERPDVVRRFLREARAASAVHHPNVVQIHDVLQLEDGRPVMVMDLLVGESLGDRLNRQGSIPLPDLARVLVPVISAVGTAHALGIVHRDLKPDNIFLVRRPDGSEDPQVLDFGIAKLTADEGEAAKTAGLTQTGSMLGTPYYMSPEQAFGEKGVDQRADVWAMGVILYQCLTGRRPVSGENLGQLFKVLMSGDIVPIRQVAPHLPDDVCHLIDRMLVTDRHQRLPDLREVLAVLKRYTDAAAQTFDAPIAPIETETTHGSSVLPAVPQDAATPIVVHGGTVAMQPGDALPATTAAPLTRASSGPSPPRPGGRSGPLIAGIVLALVVGGGLAAFFLSRGAPADVASDPSDQVEAPAATGTPEVSVAPAEPAAEAVAPAASSAPEPAVSSAAPVPPPVVPARPGKLPPRAGATKSAAPPPPTAPATEKKQLPGGVVGDVPF